MDFLQKRKKAISWIGREKVEVEEEEEEGEGVALKWGQRIKLLKLEVLCIQMVDGNSFISI